MKKGRVLGVDLGLKRTGLALSDELRWVVKPLATLTPSSRANDVEYLLALCEKEGVSEVVVGYPLLPVSGEEGFMAKRARNFAHVLQETIDKKELKIIVHLLDESYTSQTARERLHHQGVKKKNIKKSLDSEVACILVEAFIG